MIRRIVWVVSTSMTLSPTTHHRSGENYDRTYCYHWNGSGNSNWIVSKRDLENALKGISGVAPITLFDASDFLIKIACEVKGFYPEEHIPAKEARRRDRYEQLATVAAKDAIHQAGLETLSSEAQKNRVGVTVSSAIGGNKNNPRCRHYHDPGRTQTGEPLCNSHAHV